MLELAHATVPNLSRLAVLMNPRYQSHRDALKTVQALALRIGVQIQPIEGRSAEEIEKGFSRMAEQKAEAVIVVNDPIFFEQRRQIAALALKGGLACISYSALYAEAGFLIGYGTNPSEMYRRTAYYVDKIVKGAKPADLPVEQPTKFELAINLKTAKTLGIKIPPPILLRADRLIE